MPCNAYKDALSEAAAGASISSALRSHLESCADCRVALAGEQALYASIDAGLRVVANAAVPPALVSSVRAHLDEQPAPRPWFVPVFVPVAAALVLTFFILRSLQLRPEKSSTPTTRASVNEPRSPHQAASPMESASNSGVATASRALPHHTPSHEPFERNTIPEVLVTRDDEALLLQYAQEWGSQRHARLTAEVLPSPSYRLLEVTPIQIAPLDVKPLEDAGSR